MYVNIPEIYFKRIELPRRTAHIFKCVRVLATPLQGGTVGLRLNNHWLRFKDFSSIFYLWFKVIQDRLHKIPFSCNHLVSCLLFQFAQTLYKIIGCLVFVRIDYRCSLTSRLFCPFSYLKSIFPQEIRTMKSK